MASKQVSYTLKKSLLRWAARVKSEKINYDSFIGKNALWDCSKSRGFYHLGIISCIILGTTKYKVKIQLTHYIPTEGPYIRYVHKSSLTV
jgi:hypothetical protein